MRHRPGSVTPDGYTAAQSAAEEGGRLCLAPMAVTRTPDMRVYGRRARARSRRRVRRVTVAVAAVFLAIAAAVGVRALIVAGQVPNGTQVAGVDIGGKDPAAARRLLATEVAPRLDRPLTITVGGGRAVLVPSQLGIRLDAAATVHRARQRASLLDQLLPFQGRRSVAPVLRLPAGFTPPPELGVATRKPVDASLSLLPNGTAQVTPAQAGYGPDPKAALTAIADASLSGRSQVTLSFGPRAPAITTAAAQRAQARLTTMLSAPIQLTRGHSALGRLARGQLAPLITAEPAGHAIVVAFDPDRVQAQLTPLLRGLLRPARNATWAVDGHHARLVGDRSGIALDSKATARHMTAAALSTDPSARVARLGFALAHPTFTTDQAKALHITDAVGVFTSDMGVSSANRIFNVHLMARILDGKIIHPGATFSFNQVVGPRTAQRGFLEGQAIENGQLVPSIGGGVCQVATTVFNAAFLAGLPIVSRTNHSFYISHYPLGLDATVADGGPDLVFRNDTGKPILIRTSYTDQTLTVGFYSSPTGRTVHYQTSSQTGQTQPVTEYKYDATLPPGTISQQTSGEAGFDVSVTRTVLDGHGHTLRTDTFQSHYVPENLIYTVGRGAAVPKGVTVQGAPPPPAPKKRTKPSNPPSSTTTTPTTTSKGTSSGTVTTSQTQTPATSTVPAH
jgi:vancomycin resistance protein YoaR